MKLVCYFVVGILSADLVSSLALQTSEGHVTLRYANNNTGGNADLQASALVQIHDKTRTKTGRSFTTSIDLRTTNWKIAKFVLGIILLLPAMPTMFQVTRGGSPLSPFLIESDEVPSWPRWRFDIVQAMAITGIDLIMLAAVEHDWTSAMMYIRCFLILVFLFLGLATFLYSVISVNSKHAKRAPKEGEKAESDELVATNQFHDVGNSMVFLLVLSLAQCALMKFYFNSMMQEHKIDATAYKFFLAAIPMQIISQSMLGSDFCSELRLWNRFLNSPGAGLTVQRGDGDTSEIMHVSYANVLTRAIMSFYVNNACIACMFLTLPILMMQTEADIDFVKDCFAVVFITTIDDLSDTIPLKVLEENADNPEKQSALPA